MYKHGPLETDFLLVFYKYREENLEKSTYLNTGWVLGTDVSRLPF